MTAVRPKNWYVIGLFAAAIVVLLPIAIWIGVTNSNEGSPATITPRQGAGATNVLGVAPPGTQNIAIRDFTYDPKDVTVHVGVTFDFHNDGPSQHTVTFDNGPDSGIIDRGASFQWKPSTPGNYTFHCRIHPNQMNGAIHVLS